ncbi:MAG: oligosaccharide flippase family protein [Haliscomenobacter sp.]|nr:oligosaccharide flippase family protein [Haliscomenobacter sp.]
MGIIIRQVTKRSIITYTGVAIGAISTLFIYPLDKETYGLAQFILSMAALLVPFAGLGVNTLVVRYFPLFRNPESRHHGFLGFLLVYALAALCLFWGAVALFKKPFLQLLDTLHFDVDLFQDNFLFIGLILCFLVFSNILEAHSSNFNRVAIRPFFRIASKVALPVVFLLFWVIMCKPVFLSAGVSGNSVCGPDRHGVVRGGGLGSYLRLEPAFLTPSLFRQMGNFALFGILSSLAGTLPFRIDSIMVASMIDVGSNGIYSISNFIVNVIEIPYLAIVAIAAPIIAGAFQRRAQGEIRDLYRKGSLNLLIAGMLAFLLVWISVDDLPGLPPL